MRERIRKSFRGILEHLYLLSWVARVVRQFKLYVLGILALNIAQMLMTIGQSTKQI